MVFHLASPPYPIVLIDIYGGEGRNMINLGLKDI